MLTALVVLALLAIVATIVSATGHCPLWVPVFILSVALLLQVVPLKG
jgi:hypothetical protein